ncbi:MAG: hypothetical protein QOH06_1719 [Acidobacteriota bacterium]|jgi:hypothetical protein|nr:hypothetical protein [Acidobacteriota bacterium]
MRGWYGGLLAGLLPVLLLGFGYSALADRTAFMLWALGVSIAWVFLLRQGMEAGLRTPLLAGWLLLLLAAGLAGFAWLESKHHESLDLGFRAVLPGIYRPAFTSPRSAGVVAGLLGAAGLAGCGLGYFKREAR